MEQKTLYEGILDLDTDRLYGSLAEYMGGYAESHSAKRIFADGDYGKRQNPCESGLREETGCTDNCGAGHGNANICNADNGDAGSSAAEDSDTARNNAEERCIGILLHSQCIPTRNYEPYRLLKKELESLGIHVICAFSSGGSEHKSFRQVVRDCFQSEGRLLIRALVVAQILPVTPEEGRSIAEQSVLEYEALGIPVFYPVQAFYVSRDEWERKNQPLLEDISNGYTIPEMSGMIEPVLISTRNKETGETEVLPEQIARLAGRIDGWLKLQEKPNREKKLVLMLHNAVCSGVEATIGKAYGLDALESVVRILRKLQEEGYSVGNAVDEEAEREPGEKTGPVPAAARLCETENLEHIPETGAELLALLQEKKAFSDFRWTAVEDIAAAGGCLYRMSDAEYGKYYAELPAELRAAMEKTWGTPPGEGMVLDGDLIITGLRFGNVLVMIQPKRGCYGAKCTGEVCKILHDPLCPPPHQYLAVYRYIQRVFQADVCVDIGTEGSVEFLPGKSNGLSEKCWPRVITADTPMLYLYHAGVPGEALAAKRRSHALTLSHLPAAMHGLHQEEKLLLKKAEEYLRAAEQKNGQEELLRLELEKRIPEIPAAKRIMEHASSFDQGIRELSDAAALLERGGKSGNLHIYGETPDEEEMAAYGDEAGDWDQEEIRMRLKRTGDSETAGLLKALDGGYVPPSESGMPDENGLEILPTGRNMCGTKEKDFPGRIPYRRGMALADQLLEGYREDEGSFPEKVALNMISLDITRTGGEQLSEFLYLLGVRPVWDEKERVRGLEAISPLELGRPRIDATVRISGVLRDTWPNAVKMMDEAVLLVSSLSESPEINYVRKHILEYQDSYGDGPEREKTIRIFGDPPGGYGTGVDLALKASAWQDEKDLAKYFLQSSAFAYGNGLDGEKKVRALADNMKTVQAATDVMQSRRLDLLSSDFSLTVQGGMSLAAKYIGGQEVRCYEGLSEKNKEVQTEALKPALDRMMRETLLNPFWQEDRKGEGYEGASEMMCRVQNVFAAQCLMECVEDSVLDALTEAYVNNEEMRAWIAGQNPYAAEEIARRMLELAQREKWQPGDGVLERLKENYLEIEGDMEGSLESLGDIQAGEVEIITHREQEAWQENLRDVEEWIR